MSETPMPMNPPIVSRVRQPPAVVSRRVVVGRESEQRGDTDRGCLGIRAARPVSARTAARQRARAARLTIAASVVVTRPK